MWVQSGLCATKANVSHSLMSTGVHLTDASPTALELPVWTQVEDVLQRTDEILLELGVYRGATLQIRDVSSLFELHFCYISRSKYNN